VKPMPQAAQPGGFLLSAAEPPVFRHAAEQEVREAGVDLA
jgi:hypothetical protein